MVHGDFENAQADTRCFHLHLQIPAVGLLAHVEPFECNTANRAKWRHVRVMNAVKQSQEESGDSPVQDLLEVHAAWFALSARARTDHEIVRPAYDRLDKVIH